MIEDQERRASASCVMTMSAARAIIAICDIEEPMEFTTLEALFDAFQADMERILA
ncbi:hypothetical protein GGE56_004299 [Rhizobium leguminosarum]|uniref:Uncharacterized protein n=1 Tax=Rhizobium esperanzae TaxID=1967781 RepID=A0A7W6XZ34_9HYPH|nr:hypothetical protein [Rhizobium leguminosarum]MBB4441590.1 hypothetical protein [Rhizobium esperanzae]MBX5164626.1 hypothetical protein [Rhizobium sp. NZLR4b]MBX5190941.1 hypothetical protein [Rhizobium sp. NZLR3b]MBX5204556.1 hypothetical protein [Rhizobium sp. NZLR1]